MNPQDQSTRLESAFESHCARMYGQYLDQLDEAEQLADIEQEFWDDLNFNDLCHALDDEQFIDGPAFVRAFGKGDAEQVLSLLQDAAQSYIEQCAKNEYARREQVRELEAAADEQWEMEEAEWERRMRG